MLGRVLQGVAVCCSVLQCVAVCCSVLQCVAVCCSVLQCVAVCCSVLQYVAVCFSAFQFVTVLGSVLQCVALCCHAHPPSPSKFTPFFLEGLVQYVVKPVKETCETVHSIPKETCRKVTRFDEPYKTACFLGVNETSKDGPVYDLGLCKFVEYFHVFPTI